MLVMAAVSMVATAISAWAAVATWRIARQQSRSPPDSPERSVARCQAARHEARGWRAALAALRAETASLDGKQPPASGAHLS